METEAIAQQGIGEEEIAGAEESERGQKEGAGPRWVEGGWKRAKKRVTSVGVAEDVATAKRRQPDIESAAEQRCASASSARSVSRFCDARVRGRSGR